MKTKIDMAYFPSVEGSMTSEDGQTFMLHVKRGTGGDPLLGFRHTEISNIVENAAMQAVHVCIISLGRDLQLFAVSKSCLSEAFADADGAGVLQLRRFAQPAPTRPDHVNFLYNEVASHDLPMF